MRILKIDEIKKFTKQTQPIVDRAVAEYNKNCKDKLIRNGTRRERNEEEQKALDSFTLK